MHLCVTCQPSQLEVPPSTEILREIALHVTIHELERHAAACILSTVENVMQMSIYALNGLFVGSHALGEYCFVSRLAISSLSSSKS